MKRWMFLLIGALFLFGLHRENNNIQVEEIKKVPIKAKVVDRLTTFIPRQIPARSQVVIPHRTPARYVQPARPQKFSNAILSENSIKIGKNFNVVDGVASLEKDKYKPSLGKKISENDRYIFFQPVSPTIDASPVALSATNLQLYPISHILHVKDIDDGLRAQFKAEGMQEYYYHSRLKFISLETSPATVIKQFQELTARGFQVSLEVLKETPQSH